MQNSLTNLDQQADNGSEPKRAKVLGALNNPDYVWRTVDGLAQETKLSKSDILAELEALPADTLAVTTAKTGKLYTTRDHYFKSQSFLGRFLTAATGQFK